LFVLFFDYFLFKQVTALKNFIESVYDNYDYSLFNQVTVWRPGSDISLWKVQGELPY